MDYNPESAPWIWVDLEMTGLDVETCTILQIATVITDPQINELASLDLVVWQSEATLEQMAPYVRDMHTHNGLLERVRRSSDSLRDAEAKTLALVSQHVPYRTAHLAGSSVWMDRRFLHRHMPHLEDYLHHRQVDVSTLKVVCRAWYGSRGLAPERESSHTALDDIRRSIEELRYYRDTCFAAP